MSNASDEPEMEARSPADGAGVVVGVKFARLIKWENELLEDGTYGKAIYERGPLEILEGPDEQSMKLMYRRPDYAPS